MRVTGARNRSVGSQWGGDVVVLPRPWTGPSPQPACTRMTACARMKACVRGKVSLTARCWMNGHNKVRGNGRCRFMRVTCPRKTINQFIVFICYLQLFFGIFIWNGSKKCRIALSFSKIVLSQFFTSFPTSPLHNNVLIVESRGWMLIVVHSGL